MTTGSLMAAEEEINASFQQMWGVAEDVKNCWDDEVRRRFYDQFLDEFPRHFSNFRLALQQLREACDECNRVISESH